MNLHVCTALLASVLDAPTPGPIVVAASAVSPSRLAAFRLTSDFDAEVDRSRSIHC